ncbi:MAG: hypothetical protein ACREXR_21925, partial [Gammaproteobacteria bacterium]
MVLDGVYRATDGVPVFHTVHAPTATELQTLLNRIIKRLMKLLTRKGYLIEEQGMTYLGDTDPDLALGPLHAAACTYRIRPRASGGPESADLTNCPEPPPTPQRCVN